MALTREEIDLLEQTRINPTRRKDATGCWVLPAKAFAWRLVGSTRRRSAGARRRRRQHHRPTATATERWMSSIVSRIPTVIAWAVTWSFQRTADGVVLVLAVLLHLSIVQRLGPLGTALPEVV